MCSQKEIRQFVLEHYVYKRLTFEPFIACQEHGLCSYPDMLRAIRDLHQVGMMPGYVRAVREKDGRNVWVMVCLTPPSDKNKMATAWDAIKTAGIL
jgi:hypothetical protein